LKVFFDVLGVLTMEYGSSIAALLNYGTLIIVAIRVYSNVLGGRNGSRMPPS